MMNREEILRTNRRVYDAMAMAQEPLCRPATDQDLHNPLATVDPAGWLGNSITGKQVLCLAAGGGRQSALYAAAGGNVTVVDLSPAMLELDRQVARERGFAIRIYEGSMDDLHMLSDQEFDIVIHPVSTCYVPRVEPVFREVARIMRPGGVYVSQHKQPTSLQASTTVSTEGQYTLLHPYQPGYKIPEPNVASGATTRLRERGAMEFLHTGEQILGGICRAGFWISDVVEPNHAKQDAPPNTFSHRCRYIPPYIRIRAVRNKAAAESAEPRAIII